MSGYKRMRNRIYRGCGGTIVAAIRGSANSSKTLQVISAPVTLGGVDIALLMFETIALFAFGAAWLVKGDGVGFLRDPAEERSGSAAKVA